MALETYPLFIGGEEVSTSETTTIRLPYDGSPVALVAQAEAAHVERAVAAAAQGAQVMARLSNGERAGLLFRAAELLRAATEEFARLLVLESGKPISESRIEASRAAETCLESAIVARELCGEAVPIDAVPGGKDRMAITIRQPLGVIAAITPFNWPLNLAMHKIGPALASGNSVVHKPADRTPLTAVRLARLFNDAGFPKGAYNVIAGDGATLGPLLVQHKLVRMVTFTGSVEVGQSIRERAGLKRVALELGGNSPAIIERDADLDLAVTRCTQGAFAHSGQICISVQRIFVHSDVAPQFTERLVESASRLKIGHPMDEATEISSLISEDQARRVEAWINEAVADGGKLLTGGRRNRATLTPAVLESVPGGARISCQEVFGPVVVIGRYRDLREAIGQANATPYGLQAGIFTRNLQHAFEAARNLEAGGVMINDVPTFRADPMPYGGMKNSGIGKEGPRYTAEEMTETKLICWR